MHISHLPQCTTLKKMCTFLFQGGALWVRGEVHHGNCEIVLLSYPCQNIKDGTKWLFPKGSTEIRFALVQIMAGRRTGNNHYRKQGFDSLFAPVPVTRPPWASWQIRKIAGAHAPGMPGTFSPPPQLSDPDMHHGTCVTHVLWCMPGSLTSGFLWSRPREGIVPGIPATCTTRNFTYLVRGPCTKNQITSTCTIVFTF